MGRSAAAAAGVFVAAGIASRDSGRRLRFFRWNYLPGLLTARCRRLSSEAKPARTAASVPVAAASSGVRGGGFVARYLGMIKSRPVLTKSVTAGSILVAADVASQMITLDSDNSFDLGRTLRIGSYGLLISGPLLHFWFNSLAKISQNQM